MVKILSAVLTDSLAAVEAACAEALTGGVHSADSSSTSWRGTAEGRGDCDVKGWRGGKRS
jgi:hypothetical protein